MELKVGTTIKCLGHKLKIIDIGTEDWGVRRVYLNCAPNCCTTPYNLQIYIADIHLIEALERNKMEET